VNPASTKGEQEVQVFGNIEKPLPRPSEDSAPFWEAAGKGELRMQRCGDCGHVRFPPALLCPRCLSPNAVWERLSGRGSVYSWVVVHQSQHPAFNPDAPYNVVIVELEEGPRLHGNLVDCANDAIRIGLAVEAVFAPVGGDTALVQWRRRG
jgi:hypothetical protein